MANKGPRPGRVLVVFGLVLLAAYVGLALNGVWKPALGLDLQGGTRITLQASTATGETITPEKLEEAASIIDSRVNGSGVSESEVSTQGSDTIIIEIPGESRKDLVDSVKQTAQLRFRLVAATASGQPLPEPSPSASPSATPEPSPSATPESSPAASPSASPKQRALSSALTASGDTTPTPTPDTRPSGQPSDQPSDQPSASVDTPVPTDESSVEEQLAWMRNPDSASLADFSAFTCGTQDTEDNPAKPLITCDEEGNKYLLGPALIEGTQLTDASSGIPQNSTSYAVLLEFNDEATDTFAQVTRAMAGTGELFAIVLDGEVLSSPRVDSAILDGNAQITGTFDAETSQSLATSLRYGALPLTFEESVVSEEGPTLAADQLQAGIVAGIVGLVLVGLYALFYYRGLGLVVIASLGVAGAITYAAVLFLSEVAGFTLTLPGIAGLIVGVGVTADSFIVYFERIRDEMRDGKSIRVAVEAGWDRAKMTCVIADAVSLLAAVVLYLFAIGVVKGFAFALGISTVIDLLVFFFFTKPLVSWLVRFRFFGTGHPMSGLSLEHAGITRPAASTPVQGAVS